MIYILQKYKELGRTEEENDFGPAPHQVSVLSPSFSSVLPLGYTGASIEELNQFENSKNGNRSDDKDGKGEKKRGAGPKSFSSSVLPSSLYFCRI